MNPANDNHLLTFFLLKQTPVSSILDDYYIDQESINVKQIFDSMKDIAEHLQFMRDVIDDKPILGQQYLPGVTRLTVNNRRLDWESQVIWVLLRVNFSIALDDIFFIPQHA